MIKDLFESQSHHQWNGNKTVTSIIGLWGFNEILFIRQVAQCLAHKKIYFYKWMDLVSFVLYFLQHLAYHKISDVYWRHKYACLSASLTISICFKLIVLYLRAVEVKCLGMFPSVLQKRFTLSHSRTSLVLNLELFMVSWSSMWSLTTVSVKGATWIPIMLSLLILL